MNKYITKDSGKRQEYKSGMRRDLQEGKTRYDLVIPLDMEHSLFERWAELMTRGAVKYGERNWEKANSTEEYMRFRASAFRHFMQWFNGKDDEDHGAAVLFNIQCADYVKEKLND